jgi:hypothetical protein
LPSGNRWTDSANGIFKIGASDKGPTAAQFHAIYGGMWKLDVSLRVSLDEWAEEHSPSKTAAVPPGTTINVTCDTSNMPSGTYKLPKLNNSI